MFNWPPGALFDLQLGLYHLRHKIKDRMEQIFDFCIFRHFMAVFWRKICRFLNFCLFFATKKAIIEYDCSKTLPMKLIYI